MARPKSARLSRDRIAQAAIEYVEAGNDLQVVPLAKRLGVSVSSLYHHVDGRDGVIHAMRAELASRYLAPTSEGLGWADRIRAEVECSWKMYAEYPRVLQQMLTVVIDEPFVLRMYDTIADALAEAGLPDAEIVTTIEVIDAFTFGAALDAMSPDTILDATASSSRLTDLLVSHPSGQERNRRMFDRGLDLLLAGIETRAGAGATASAS